MKKHRILVTAVGAIVGYGIVDCLRLGQYNPYIIGTDIFTDAVGQFFCDEFITSIPAADDDYPEFLVKLIDDMEIDLVLFGIEQEISKISGVRECLGESVQKMAINKKPLIELCEDKWETGLLLLENGLDEYVIESTTDFDYSHCKKSLGDTFLLKPRRGRASKGIVTINSEKDFNFFGQKMGDEFMAQKIVGDIEDEYTVSVFGQGDGNIINSIYLRRKLSQEGATSKATVVFDESLEIATKRITELLKPEGPTNYQFRKEGDRVFLLEVNPRISSAVSIRAKFGYNEPDMCISHYIMKERPVSSIISKGTAIRYIKDLVIHS
ncbi:MAG: carbamoyl-phosphate synthase subunit L [Ruminococcaceae bacterium]|nr:carbamoyl-phosphate synthase subunit L [Oscillospiraceae bacterium]